jgi:hypothetical protein
MPAAAENWRKSAGEKTRRAFQRPIAWARTQRPTCEKYVGRQLEPHGALSSPSADFKILTKQGNVASRW